MIKKNYEYKWIFEAPEAILACKVLKCKKNLYLVFGGHDKTLYIMDLEMNIIDSIDFDGWVRCIRVNDIDGDGCDEILAGTGDGNFLVIKFDEDNKQMVGIKHYITNGKVLCCATGDITRDGQYELIFGGDNNKLEIFKDFLSKSPKFTQYYESWITACSIGLLKLQNITTPIMGLIIGTKKGLIQLIHIENDDLKIYWHKDLNCKINDIQIADINHNGYNEIIICSDDFQIKIFNSNGDCLDSIYVPNGRPLSLLIEDVDGDNSNEIIAGCANGNLCVYQNIGENSVNFELKWSAKAKSSIQDISCIRKDAESIKQVVFGGYDKTIRNIVDFEWGSGKKIDIPKKISLPEVKKSYEKNLEYMPTNLDEFIEKLVRENIYIDGENLTKDLEKLGYPKDLIKKKVNNLIENNQLVLRTKNLDIWHYIKKLDELKIKQNTKQSETKVIENKTEDQQELKNENPKLLKDLIIEILKQKGNISTKTELINLVSQKGFPKKKIESQIDSLSEKNIVFYSHSTPRGWSLKSDDV